MSHCLVYVVCANLRESEKIGALMVEEGFAACANILPEITSIFIWSGTTKSETESLLLLKTKNKLFQELTRRVMEVHSYDVPAIIKIPVEIGNKSFENFIDKNTI
ncbi:divalent-cation tolerance protein CutA [Oligoflexaceae bacterium]|nr:divalent-cation tolerance protein CutA [Oligoflexaceae bacterium]